MKPLCCLLVLFLPAALSAAEPSASALTVFTARKIMTMEPALPEASAVAASEGRIVAVGNLASMQPWIDARGGTIDRTLEDKVLMPGSIRAGKRADFTVLDADPYEVGAKGLKEIRVWGTVFEGELAPLRPDPLH